MWGDTRGQAYTIEGIIGAIVIVSALVLGLQAVDIAPWAETSGEQETESIRAQTQDLLEAAEDRGALRTAATCIGGDAAGTPDPAVAAGNRQSDSERPLFGTLLNRTLDSNGHRYSVYIDYPNANGNIDTVALTPDQEATRSSVTVTRQITLHDIDPVLEFDSDEGGCVPAGTSGTLEDTDIYVANQNDSSDLYAVVTVRVVAW